MAGGENVTHSEEDVPLRIGIPIGKYFGNCKCKHICETSKLGYCILMCPTLFTCQGESASAQSVWVNCTICPHI
jgi:hypothetical protein